MSKVPPTTEQLSDVDQLYRRLSAQDAGRPGEWVRRKVQAYAAQQAAERAVRSNAKGNESVSVAATPAPPPPGPAPVSAEEDLSAPADKPWVIPAVIGVVAAVAVVGWFVVPAMLGSGQTSKSPPVAAAQPEPSPPAAQAPAPGPAEPATSQASEPEPAEVSSAQTPVTNDSTTAAATPPAPPPTAQRAPAPAASAASAGAVAQVPSPSHPSASGPAHVPAAATTPTGSSAGTVAQAPVAKTRVARQNAVPAASEQTAYATPAAARPTPVAEAAPAPKPAPPVETPVASAAPPAPAPAPTPAAAQPAPAPAAAGSSYPSDGLWTAAKAGDMSGLQGAFDNHVDVNSVGPEGETALILAIQHDRVEAVRALLAHGANPNTPDSRGLTPIRAARVRNNYNVLQALQRAGR
jgi:hypothetical protein